MQKETVLKKFEYCYIKRVISGNLMLFSELILPNDKVVKIGEEGLSDVLNDLGKDNWEMVGCGNVGKPSHVIYFKREIC